jgi:diacylglycerol kinase family enzyme
VGLSPEEAATRFCQPRTQRVDVGIVEYETHSGTKARQAFLNALSFGLGGLTTRLVDGSPKWLGGRATYLLGALRANLLHQPKPIELRIDGRRLPIAPYANVAVCLGRYFGGGMKIAPNAELDDGLFDIVTIEADRLAVAALSLDIYRGSHLRRTGVRVERAASVTASSTTGAEVLLDLDGNQPGKLPLSIELLPLGLELAL